jgi:hypothetical protein
MNDWELAQVLPISSCLECIFWTSETKLRLTYSNMFSMESKTRQNVENYVSQIAKDVVPKTCLFD